MNQPRQYTERSPVVDAIQYDGGNAEAVEAFIGGSLSKPDAGDWYFKDANGVLSAVSDAAFTSRYAPLGPTTTDGPAPSTL